MKFVLLSDVHLVAKTPISRLDNTMVTGLNKLEHVFRFAFDNFAFIIQAGDLFDIPRSWYLLTKVTELFKKWSSSVTFFSVFGQHDTYKYSEGTRYATMLGALQGAGLVTILNNTPVNPHFGIDIYGTSYGSDVPKIKRVKDVKNILCIHKNISNRPTYTRHKYSDANLFLRNNKFDVIVCGDIHRKFKITLKNKSGKKRYIVNTGPLIRRNAEAYMFKHKPGFFVYDTVGNDIEWCEVPHEPAEKILTTEHTKREQKVEESLTDLIDELNKHFKRTRVNFKEVMDVIFKKYKIDNETQQLCMNIIDESAEEVGEE